MFKLQEVNFALVVGGATYTTKISMSVFTEDPNSIDKMKEFLDKNGVDLIAQPSGSKNLPLMLDGDLFDAPVVDVEWNYIAANTTLGSN